MVITKKVEPEQSKKCQKILKGNHKGKEKNMEKNKIKSIEDTMNDVIRLKKHRFIKRIEFEESKVKTALEEQECLVVHIEDSQIIV